MGLIEARQALLEDQALVLVRAGLGGRGITHGSQVVLVQPGLLRQLQAIAPVLHLPRHPDREHQQDQAEQRRQLQGRRVHGTSL
ncbi:hypothetical protein D3C76_1483090 [compost metagenome]